VLIAIYLLGFAFWPFYPHDIASLFRRWWLTGNSATQLSYLIAAVPAILAAVLGTWALAYLSGATASGTKPGAQLVTVGPYRYVRHPVYLATLFNLVSFAFLLNRLGFLIAVLGGLAFLAHVILREEVELHAAFGEDFERYRERVPRLFPVLIPKWPRGNSTPDWAGGWLGGAYLWLFAGSLVALAVSLKESLFFAVLAVGMAARFASNRWTRHRVAPVT
jgi:protein-S-isoprenylcysteine O-methyltransferase Ste14